jgi:hypothetical protein
MTTYIKKNQKLPDDIKRHFESFASNTERDQLIVELVDAGWTYESISAAANITRERVRQIYSFEPAPGEDPIPTVPLNIEIPTPPVKPERPGPSYVEPDPKSLARLLELQPYAQQVRSNGKKYREEAEEYTKLLNHVHVNEGVTLYRLAKRLGVTHGALRFRLVRYGYKKPITATSKVYTPIVKENRL